jgi:hypothetical protein
MKQQGTAYEESAELLSYLKYKERDCCTQTFGKTLFSFHIRLSGCIMRSCEVPTAHLLTVGTVHTVAKDIAPGKGRGRDRPACKIGLSTCAPGVSD